MLDGHKNRAVAAAVVIVAGFGLAGCNAEHRATITAGVSPAPVAKGSKSKARAKTAQAGPKRDERSLAIAPAPGDTKNSRLASRPAQGGQKKAAKIAVHYPPDHGLDDPEPAYFGSLALEKAAMRRDQARQAGKFGRANFKVGGTVSALVAVRAAGTSAAARAPASRAILRAKYKGSRRWSAAYPHVRTRCFGPVLRRALNRIGARFNTHVSVTSGHRTRGRRRSMHRFCRAADIRVPGVRPSAVARFARSLPGINGVGTYRRKSITHIDTRRQRMVWRH